MKHFCPECEEETNCSHICNVYSCSKCGKDFDCYENFSNQESCSNCRFHHRIDNSGFLLCRRYPNYCEKHESDWCGEWALSENTEKEEVKPFFSIESKICSNCFFHFMEERTHFTYCNFNKESKFKKWNDTCNEWKREKENEAE